MIGVGDSWPVRIGEVGDVATTFATVVWRVHGADEIRVSVIVKATLTIVPEGEMVPREADGLVVQEAHHHADSHCSLRAGSDLAPYLGQAELLVTGHAYAASGTHTSVAGARVVVHREGQVLLSKTISVYGDRTLDRGGHPTEPSFYQRIPLIYERAAWHPEVNPIGVDPRQGVPNLVHATDPSIPACFGPLARHWPVRRRLLGNLDPRQLDGTRLEFPQGFMWEYYQVAPPDQRLDFLHGTEGILLGGMHPTLPMVRSRLPGVRAVACVYPDRDRDGERLPLWADTMLIDTDRQTCSLVWRGNFAVTDEAALRTARVRVGVELPDRPVTFPGELGIPRSYTSFPEPHVAPEAEGGPSEQEQAEYQVADGVGAQDGHQDQRQAEYQLDEYPAQGHLQEQGEELEAVELAEVEPEQDIEELNADALEAVDDEAVDDEAVELLEEATIEPAEEAPVEPQGTLGDTAFTQDPEARGDEESDEDVVATQGVGFRAPPHLAPVAPQFPYSVHGDTPLPPVLPPPVIELPAGATFPEPAPDAGEDDEDAIVTPRGNNPAPAR
ncbi:DUF2169 family type VI secretion system accessory protein [Chondromyces crocatus]|uniref:DUF2169 domain-containing protein n=1 Tax=Chondromyces crocatus TaxID=52 RepID=A0A0K1EQ51_CHOCO|nr:DUF2169 domain-containing protein [Chondromyces crocatus]AKT42976.1 uncharacterized protein CMC5_072040 [Chondromyces crocatus]